MASMYEQLMALPLFQGVSIIPEQVKEKLPIGFRKIYPEQGRDGNSFDRVRYL